MVSQIPGGSIVYSTVCSDADEIEHQNSASLAFARGIHRSPVNSPHKGPVTRKMFQYDDVIVIVYHLPSALGSMLINFSLPCLAVFFSFSTFINLAMHLFLITNLLIFCHPTKNISNINETCIGQVSRFTWFIHISMLFTINLVHRDPHFLIFHYTGTERVAAHLI